MTSMRIAIVKSTSPSSISMDVYARNIAEGLKVACPDWDIVTLSPNISSNPSGKVSAVVDKYYRRYWSYPMSFVQEMADVFHVVDHSDGHLIPWLKKNGKATIVTCHDLINLVQPELYRGLALAPIISLNAWRWSVRQMKSADHVLTVSTHTAKDVVRHLQVDRSNVTTVPNAVSSDFRKLSESKINSFRQQFGLSSQTFCILNVGSNNPRKNISAILKVVNELSKRRMPVRFLKAGSDFNPEQYEFIQSHQLESYVSYIGKLDNAKLIEIYNAANVLLAPSLYEGFGLTVLEAMACGTPVVTSNVSSLPEVAGDAAVLTAPEDIEGMTMAIQRLIEDREFRRGLIDAGFSRVKAFTWVNTAKQAADVYEHVYQSNHGAT